jgi:hypothetical protein
VFHGLEPLPESFEFLVHGLEPVVHGLEPVVHGFEPEAHPLLEGVEVALGGDVGPAHRGHHLHQPLRRLRTQHLFETEEQLVS